QAQNARLDHLLPRDSQQLLDQRSPLFARHADLFRMMQQPAARRQTRNEQVGVQRDPSEQIVEIMSHAAYQAPDDLHLLRFPKTLLRAFALGDVLGHADRELGLAIDAPDQRNRKTHPPRNTRLAQVAQFQFVRDGYLLHSPNPNRLWFWIGCSCGVKNPSQGNGLDLQRLLDEAKE